LLDIIERQANPPFVNVFHFACYCATGVSDGRNILKSVKYRPPRAKVRPGVLVQETWRQLVGRLQEEGGLIYWP